MRASNGISPSDWMLWVALFCEFRSMCDGWSTDTAIGQGNCNRYGDREQTNCSKDITFGHWTWKSGGISICSSAKSPPEITAGEDSGCDEDGWTRVSFLHHCFLACLHLYANVNLRLDLPLSSRSLHDLNDWTRTHSILHNLDRAFAYTDFKYLEIYDLEL